MTDFVRCSAYMSCSTKGCSHKIKHTKSSHCKCFGGARCTPMTTKVTSKVTESFSKIMYNKIDDVQHPKARPLFYDIQEFIVKPARKVKIKQCPKGGMKNV